MTTNTKECTWFGIKFYIFFYHLLLQLFVQNVYTIEFYQKDLFTSYIYKFRANCLTKLWQPKLCHNEAKDNILGSNIRNAVWGQYDTTQGHAIESSHERCQKSRDSKHAYRIVSFVALYLQNVAGSDTATPGCCSMPKVLTL